MVQHILPVAGSVPESADELYQLAVQPVYIGFQDGTLALLLDLVFHLTPRLIHHFLDAGGMDPTVADELLQSDPGNLPAHMVKAGQGDSLRGIINDEIYSGEGFQRPDVPALPSDDASLHFVIGQCHHGNRRFGHLLRRTFCNGKGNVVPCLLVALVLDLLFVAGDLQRLFVHQVILQHIEHVFLCLFPGQLGNALQHIHFTFLEGLRLLEPILRRPDLVLELFFLPLQVVVLPVEIFFLLLDATLLPGDLSPAILDLPLRLRADHAFRLTPAVCDACLKKMNPEIAAPTISAATPVSTVIMVSSTLYRPPSFSLILTITSLRRTMSPYFYSFVYTAPVRTKRTSVL